MQNPKSEVQNPKQAGRVNSEKAMFLVFGIERLFSGLEFPGSVLILLTASVFSAWQASSADLAPISWQGETMGSDYVVKVAGAKLASNEVEALKAMVDERLRGINRQMSHFDPESELSRFNHAPASQPFAVSPEFASLVRLAIDLNRRSNGAFDPTLGPVIKLWGFGENASQRRVPSNAELQKARGKTGCVHLRVTDNNELVKDLSDLQLNLSAVAKGFGSDAIAAILRKRGLTNFYVAISGETVTSGLNVRGEKWKIGISLPLLDWRQGDPLACVVSLSGLAISTSGDYQKYYVDDQGRHWSHIVDPRTGQPARHNIGSVSVVADTCSLADALSTTLFVLGLDAGLKFLEQFPQAAALFVVRQPDGTFGTISSPGFAALTGLKRVSP